MLDRESRLRVNEQEIAAKVIDGEAIIMNLTNGMYFSMDGTGARIWECLAAGMSVAEITADIAAHYDVAEEQASRDVSVLLERLVQETLVQPDNALVPTDPPPPPGEAGLRYHAPELVKYEDMADLLALDPPMPGLAATPWTDTREPA